MSEQNNTLSISDKWSEVNDELYLNSMLRISRQVKVNHIAYLKSDYHRIEVERLGRLWEQALNVEVDNG